MQQAIFEPDGQGSLSASFHENPIVGLAPGLGYEIRIPVRCQLSLPLDPAYPLTTVVSLDLIRIGLLDWRDLPGRTFTFPTNPAFGYVDGSIYFASQHSPADLTELRFGPVLGDTVTVFVSIDFLFFTESDLPDLPSTCTANWSVELQIDHIAIDRAFFEANARSPAVPKET